MPAVRFMVRGRVQGVGYRYFVLRAAQGLGIRGYARNLGDGTVEVVAEGDEDSLDALAAQLAVGPSFADVEGVDRSPIAPRGDAGFTIR
jgi:acylphosphatase